MAIVNIAALNIGVHVSFVIVVLTGYMPWSGVAGSKVILLACLKKAKWFYLLKGVRERDDDKH